jgi:hypothetical protein
MSCNDEKAERELARRRARASIRRPDPVRERDLFPAHDRLLARFGR